MPTTPKPRPRTKPSEERREDLMNAAQQLFLQQGVAPTTIEQITMAAQVAKGTFYLHFASKEAVADGLRERFVRGLLDGIAKAVDACGEGDWRGRLAAWCQAYAHGYLDAAALHDVVFREAPPTTQEGLTSNVVIEHLTGLLAQGARAGAWEAGDPAFTAVFLFSAFHGVIAEAVVRQESVDRAALVRGMQEHSFRAIGCPR